MSEVMVQAKRYISEHPDSDVTPLLKKLLKIAERDNIGSCIQKIAGPDARELLDRIIGALSSTHLCASCQQRVHSTIMEDMELDVF
jgi:hypothetical protein